MSVLSILMLVLSLGIVMLVGIYLIMRAVSRLLREPYVPPIPSDLRDLETRPGTYDEDFDEEDEDDPDSDDIPASSVEVIVSAPGWLVRVRVRRDIRRDKASFNEDHPAWLEYSRTITSRQGD